MAWAFARLTLMILAPFETAHKEAMLQAADERSVKEKQEEKAQLEGRVAWLKSPSGAVEESRRKGMVKEGEHAVRFNLPSRLPRITSAPPCPPRHSAGSSGGSSWSYCCCLSWRCSGWLVRRRRLAHSRRPAGTLTPRSELPRRRS